MPTVIKKNKNGDTEVISRKSTLSRDPNTGKLTREPATITVIPKAENSITQTAEDSPISRPAINNVDDIQNPVHNDISLGKVNKQMPLITVALKRVVGFFTRTGTKDPEEKVSQKSNLKDFNEARDNNPNSESIEAALNTTSHQISELMKLTPEKLEEMEKLSNSQKYLDLNEISRKISPVEAEELKNAGKTLSNTGSKSSDKTRDNKAVAGSHSANKSSQENQYR